MAKVKAQTFARYKRKLVWVESVDGDKALVKIPDPPKKDQRIANLGPETFSVPISKLTSVD
jgi:hypothetical protein